MTHNNAFDVFLKYRSSLVKSWISGVKPYFGKVKEKSDLSAVLQLGLRETSTCLDCEFRNLHCLLIGFCKAHFIAYNYR